MWYFNKPTNVFNEEWQKVNQLLLNVYNELKVW